MDAVKALIQHALDVGDQYKQNMALKHGLEKPGKISLDSVPISAPPVPLAQALPVAQALPAKVESAGSKLLPLALAAATILGTGGAGAGLAALFMGGNKPAITRPAAPVVIESEAGLLSDLQERGFHLPRGDQ